MSKQKIQSSEDISRPKLTLQDVSKELRDLKDFIEKEFDRTPALDFVGQKLQEAASHVDKELMNQRMDAQLAERLGK